MRAESEPAVGGRAPNEPPPVPFRPKGLGNLDASRFQPLTTGEARATIKDLGGIKSAYLDSLSTIPDASLARIQIIDRTMVGAGLISPEELANIHETARQFEAYRGDEAALRRQADEAVRASREGSCRAQGPEEARG